jgi:hypothetical protein
MEQRMKNYDVTVRFTIPAMNEEHAMDLIEYMLKDMEEYDQLPEWWIDGGKCAEPDALYHARIAEGETAP